ncbi:MAG: NADH-quinone oxidoreductase subunit L [Deltaproteobacteria bacterium]|nr:NADH-quinone oxidoreductase subunit L [Deltaproteobacteria bacterium]
MAQTCLWIVCLPILAFVIQVFFGKRLPRQGDWVSLAAIGFSLLLAIPIFGRLLSEGHVFDTLSFSWLSLPQTAGAFQIIIGVLVNNFTAIMLMMVTLCAGLIHLFSVGYMHGEDRYHLFFAYISLFSAAMLGLVVSDNLLTFFIFWELMGLCSYLLIGFYYKKPEAIAASLKAFMTTRIGDVGLFLGLCGLYAVFGTSQFESIYAAVASGAAESKTLLGMPALTFIGFMVLMGAIGKSAQFPLHVWLPDAMEGPTPVSALIHAATMVAAGVFLLIRMFPVLEASHTVLVYVAYVGAVTAFLAALLAIVQVDIKKVLAYSTISQLGYMVMGVGVGAFAAAFLHLITHACFKACLFLCSGSVIHSVHTQDMREMGGLKSKMPWTFACMLIATLSISGLPFFSGFVSKDRVLAGALAYGMEHTGHWLIPLLGFAAAGITAFYMFRLIYMTFFGSARDEHKHHHAHEQPIVMVLPLVVLATLSFAVWFSGPTGVDAFDQVFSVHWYEHAVAGVEKEMALPAPVEHHEGIHHVAHSLALIFSLVLAGAGIFFSSLVYLKGWISPVKLKSFFSPIHTLLWNKYYFDHLYINIIIQKGLLGWNRFLAAFDDWVIDRILVDGWSRIVLFIKSIVGLFDDLVIDRMLVDGSAGMTAMGGWAVRRIQTGKVQHYLIASLAALGFGLFYLIGMR